MHVRRWLISAIAMIALVTTSVFAISGAGSATTTPKTAKSVNPTFLAKVRADVALGEKKQTYLPPTSGPTPQTGKSIVLIPCSMALAGCSRPVPAEEQAAKLLGWKVTLIDPEGVVSKAEAGVEEAIAIHANGVVLEGWDAGVIKGALAQAKAAGIKIVGITSNNADGLYNSLTPSPAQIVQQGYLAAEAAYLALNGNLHIALVEDPRPTVALGAKMEHWSL
jgi:ribose transport system substrate-binding protein